MAATLLASLPAGPAGREVSRRQPRYWPVGAGQDGAGWQLAGAWEGTLELRLVVEACLLARLVLEVCLLQSLLGLLVLRLVLWWCAASLYQPGTERRSRLACTLSW